MSAISSFQLKSLLRHDEPEKRLIVTPLLDPIEQIKGNQAAIDVRLGRAFSLVRPWSQGVAELQSTSGPEAAFEPIVEPVVLQYGQPLIMHPHQFVLARTLEVVRLPDDLVAYVIGRSSWGRRGLIVATAVVVHPGFTGPITLELKNVGEVPIALYPLDRIAQLTFHDVTAGGGDNRISSQFTSTFVPELGSVRDARTSAKLRRLADKLTKR
jgi:dCTP deaminase